MEPIEADDIKSTVLEVPKSIRDRLQMAEQKAIIVAIGSEAWKDESVPRAAVGDSVMISKYAGSLVKGMDGKEYRAVNANDIFLKIEA